MLGALHLYHRQGSIHTLMGFVVCTDLQSSCPFVQLFSCMNVTGSSDVEPLSLVNARTHAHTHTHTLSLSLSPSFCIHLMQALGQGPKLTSKAWACYCGQFVMAVLLVCLYSHQKKVAYNTSFYLVVLNICIRRLSICEK